MNAKVLFVMKLKWVREVIDVTEGSSFMLESHPLKTYPVRKDQVHRGMNHAFPLTKLKASEMRYRLEQ